MRVIVLAAATAAAILGFRGVPAHAADMAPVPAGPPVADYYDEPDEVDVSVAPAPLLVEPVPPAPVITSTTYFYGGYNYCWYEGGWRGPGWYVCDYGPWVRGSWWGGPAGWNNWVWRGGPRVYGRPYHYGPRYGYGPGRPHFRPEPGGPPHYGPGPGRPPHFVGGPGRPPHAGYPSPAPRYGGGPAGPGRPVYARQGGYPGPRGEVGLRGQGGRWRD